MKGLFLVTLLAAAATCSLCSEDPTESLSGVLDLSKWNVSKISWT